MLTGPPPKFHGTWDILVTLSRVEDDGLGEELRVLLAHSMRGHHIANARRHDPPGPCPVKRD
jgi:hypothetical protein